MAIFNKKDELEKEAGKLAKETISCIISQEMRITGEINFRGKARIDGSIDGNVHGEYLVLSESGKILGDVELDALICHGTIEGNISSKLVTAHKTAVIQGKLTAGSLTVEPGAILEGEISSSRKSNDGPGKKSSLKEARETFKKEQQKEKTS